jgi:hypothetical protein
MSADQIAEIAPMIREVFDHARLNPTGERYCCATFEVVGRSQAWAQVTPTELNIAYPLDTSPEEELREIIQKLSAAQLLSWESKTFATWSFAAAKPIEVAAVVDEILAKLFKLGDYSVDSHIEVL